MPAKLLAMASCPRAAGLFGDMKIASSVYKPASAAVSPFKTAASNRALLESMACLTADASTLGVPARVAAAGAAVSGRRAALVVQAATATSINSGKRSERMTAPPMGGCGGKERGLYHALASIVRQVSAMPRRP